MRLRGFWKRRPAWVGVVSALLFGHVLGQAIAYASSQVIVGGTTDALNATTTEYNALMGSGNWTSTEANMHGLVGSGGTISKLYVEIAGAPGASKSYDFTLMVDNSASALTCQISGAAATTCSDTSNSVSVSAGQTVSLRCVPTGTPTARAAMWTTMYAGSTTGESLMFGTTTANPTGGEFMSLHGVVGGSDNLETDKRLVWPMAGTVKKLYVELATAPGAGTSRTFTVRDNGANSSLTCTISGASDKTCNDTSNSFTFNAAEFAALTMSNSGAPASSAARWGVVVLADTAGQFPIVMSSQNNMADATEYARATATDDDPDTTESNHTLLAQSCTLQAAYVAINTAPGAGKTWDFTVMKEGSGTTNTCQVAGGSATTCNITGQSVSVADGDTIDWKYVPAGSPTLNKLKQLAIQGFIADAVSRRVGSFN